MKLFLVINFVVLFASLANGASIPRSKRQFAIVPLYSTCNDYLQCAAPAVCASGTCQCVQTYQPSGTTCISSSNPPSANGVYQVPAGVAPATFRTVYTEALTASAAAPRPIFTQPVVYYPQVVRTPTVVCGLPPCQQTPTTDLPTPAPEVTTTEPASTTQRLFDSPSIAYPGDYCTLPSILCVGGSFCSNNTCICRPDEEIENQQCVPVASTTTTSSTSTSTTTSTTTTTPVPTTTTTTTTTTPAPTTTTTTPTTTTTTTAPTTTTTEPTTTTTLAPTTTTTTAPTTTTTEPTTTTTTTTTTPEPTTTTTTTTTTEAPTTTTTTEPSTTTSTTTTTTTTTPAPTTTTTLTTTTTTEPTTTTTLPTTVTPTRDEGCTQSNCNCNSMGCSSQIVRINFVVPGASCSSNTQCLSGSYCSNSGICRCSRSFEQRGTMCIRRRK